MKLDPEHAKPIESAFTYSRQDGLWQQLKLALRNIAFLMVLAGVGVGLAPFYKPHLQRVVPDSILSPIEDLHYTSRAKLQTWVATQLELSTISPKLLDAMQVVIDAEQIEDRARASVPSIEGWQRVVDKYQEAIDTLKTQVKLTQDEHQHQFLVRYLNHLNHRHQQAQDELTYQQALQTAKGASNLHATAKDNPRQTEAAWNQIIAEWDAAIQQLTALGHSYKQVDIQAKLAAWKSLREEAITQRDRLIQQSAI